MKRNPLPNLERLREYLSYSPDTGHFIWIKTKSNHASAGNTTGYVGANGYAYIRFNDKLYLAHRLAWFLFYGKSPLVTIDHINGIRSDNRISNLREATQQEQQINRTVNTKSFTGLKGAYIDRRRGTFFSKIEIDNRTIWLGRFDTPEEAHEAYLRKAKETFGDFVTTRGQI